ncbi:serine hydrolase domain-containing protein [Viridibacillus arvi]|uniref:serine hydrolase domain-containing protein n=1 Tax=Viridibacillus arvi TaxID=263475 RepID=UPI003CFC28CC
MIDEYIKQIIQQKLLPGAVISVQQNSKHLITKSYGHFIGKDLQLHAITENTLFDLASLTKVVATLPATLYLLSRNELQLDSSVSEIIPAFRFPKVKIRHLLQHSSGLPAGLVPKVERHHTRDVMSEILACDLVYIPGRFVAYSDLGMILLGKIVEKVTGELLDQFVKRHFFYPWNMHNTQFLLPDNQKYNAATTELVRGKYVQGDVHDEKALLLGGVSGSAGLFSSAKDLLLFSEYWLGIRHQSVIPFNWMESAYKNTFLGRGLGFEVRTGEEPSVSFGKRVSVGAFGHTGFTGTSICMDPVKKSSIILLTNAVHYGRNSSIREIRRQIHDLVYEEFLN